MSNLYADIILPVPIPTLFTYNIPSDMETAVAIGSRVVVQFGRKKVYSGIVKAIHGNAPAAYETKDIMSVVDEKPVVTDRQFRLWEWMADYYMCSLGEIYKAALPSGLKLESESRLASNPFFEAQAPLTAKQETILNFVDTKKVCTISELLTHCTDFNPLPQLRELLAVDALLISEELRDSYKPKTEIVYTLANACRTDKALSEILDQLDRAPNQQKTLMAFFQKVGGLRHAKDGAPVRRDDLLADNDAARASIDALVKKGILEKSKVNISRLTAENMHTIEPHQLSAEQQRAHDEIKASFEKNNTTLLHGVTSSGKTEIYIHLIKECIAQGRQALYLLPEIALTTQIMTRLRRHFGADIGIYHSKFNDAERVEVWNKLLSGSEGEYKVVLGVRSSIFLPFRNLGLIIVDEEHETTYKQFEPSPRYNARDMAIVLAGVHNAKVLLGSATPSYESYQNATTGKYGYVRLFKRHFGIEMPEIVPIDMRQARRTRRMVSIFSFDMKEQMDKALAGGEQVILFQNRRGFAPYIECDQCAWIPKCQNCDVSLTYHKSTNQLVCHYCSFSMPMPNVCPACGSPTLEPHGYGTEKIEEEVKNVFPKARVVRMDLDTARSRKAYEQIISGFENYQYDILIGTQMISKGLDFQRVSTVGIMNVDNMLNMPDFRALERCFQLVSQVSGRAGRHGKRGKVLLQTRSIEHPVVANIIAGDYEKNTRQQLAERQMYSYPPFTRLIAITLKHRSMTTTAMAAAELAGMLRQTFGNRVLGPQEPSVNRIANYYLQRIMLKIEKQKSPQAVKRTVTGYVNIILSDSRFKSTVAQIDVDPY